MKEQDGINRFIGFYIVAKYNKTFQSVKFKPCGTL